MTIQQSIARTVFVDGRPKQPGAAKFPNKNPADSLDFWIDYTPFLADHADDTIQSWQFAITGGDTAMVVAAPLPAVQGGAGYVYLVGGTPGVTYTIAYILQTTGGLYRTDFVTLTVNVVGATVTVAGGAQAGGVGGLITDIVIAPNGDFLFTLTSGQVINAGQQPGGGSGFTPAAAGAAIIISSDGTISVGTLGASNIPVADLAFQNALGPYIDGHLEGLPAGDVGGGTGDPGSNSVTVAIDNGLSAIATGAAGTSASLQFLPVAGEPNVFYYTGSFPAGAPGVGTPGAPGPAPVIDSTSSSSGTPLSQPQLTFTPVAGSPGHYTVAAVIPAGAPGASGGSGAPGAALTIDSSNITALAPLAAPTLAFTNVAGAPGHVTVTGGIPAGQTGATGAVATLPLGYSGSWNLPSNTPSLTAGGGGGTPSQAFYVSTGGTSSITGSSTVFAAGDLLVCNAAGTAFFRVPGQPNPGYFPIIGGPNPSAPTFTIGEDGVPDGKFRWLDNSGNIGMELGPTGLAVYSLTSTTATFVSGSTSGAWRVGSFAIGGNYSVLDDGIADGAFTWQDNSGNIGMLLNGNGLSVGALTSTTGTIGSLTVGTLTVSGSSSGGSSGTTFTAADIASRNASALASGAALRQVPNVTAQRATRTYNHILVYGQSLSIGYEGGPALGFAQPFDSVMVGRSPRPYQMANAGGGETFNPVGTLTTGPATFFPAISTTQTHAANAPLAAPKTGSLANIQGVTVSGNVISWTGSSVATGVFAVGDTFDVAGFTGSGLNNNSNGTGVFTVSAVTASSITTVESLAAVATAQNGISLAQCAYANFYGEENAVGAVNQWRQSYLAAVRLDADPAHIFVVTSDGVGGQTIAQLSKTAPSPVYYNRIPGSITAVKAAAAAASSGATTGCIAVPYNQGTDDQSGGTTFESYFPALGTLQQNINADVASGYGQTKPPLFLMVQTFAFGATNDFDASGTQRMPIRNAQLAYCGLLPTMGYSTPATPDVYMVAPFYPSQKHVLHGTSNAYRLIGNHIGFVASQVLDYGKTWLPLYPILVTGRGNQVMVTFSVPVPPLVAAPAFLGCTLQASPYVDLGFCVTDAAAPTPGTSSVPITSVAIVSDTVVLITLGRALGSTPYVWYADNGAHAGVGNLRDSSSAVGINTWDFTLGNGQSQAESVPSLNGKHYSLANWSMSFALPIVPG